MSRTRYTPLTASLLAAWLAIAVSVSALHLLDGAPGKPPLPILLSVLIPLTIFFAWYRLSSEFRGYVLSLSPRVLTLLHSWRAIVGVVFIVLAANNVLPKLFALPAGWGDFAIGVTAPFVAYRLANPSHRRTFILWNLLGVTDLVVALSLAALAPFLDPSELAANGVSPAPMATLPLSLIPTFGVPLLLIQHFISITQARHWSRQRDPNLPEEISSFPPRTATN